MNVRPAKRLWPPLCVKSDTFALVSDGDHPVGKEQLMERVLERENLVPALKRVEQNKGRAGVDGMGVEELRPFLKANWPAIRQELLNGWYVPQPVRRARIPKRGGGVRKFGIPATLDRFTQQALLQVLQPMWDGTFSDGSFGSRPKRSAHQAINRAQSHLKAGYSWVVDFDLEKFSDRVNHDKLMGEQADSGSTDNRVDPRVS